MTLSPANIIKAGVANPVSQPAITLSPTLARNTTRSECIRSHSAATPPCVSSLRQKHSDKSTSLQRAGNSDVTTSSVNKTDNFDRGAAPLIGTIATRAVSQFGLYLGKHRSWGPRLTSLGLTSISVCGRQ